MDLPVDSAGWRRLHGSAMPGLLYRLSRDHATGMLTVQDGGRATEALVVRRGHAIVAGADASGRAAAQQLARWVAASQLDVHFDGQTHAHPPGPARQLHLGTWVRHHLEAQLDAARAEALERALTGARLQVRDGHALDLAHCDETDRRILAALALPRRLDQVWTLARTPRLRLLGFIHFLRSIDALVASGVVVAKPMAVDPHAHARRLLGVSDRATADELRRAYHQVARSLHPDLRGDLDGEERRDLEQRLSAVTVAYQQLAG